ncbi:MAG: cyclic nucleotide-binding domain-containing protein [Thermoanaerobaculia bacterium]
MSDPHVGQDVEELIRLAGRFQERGQHEQASDLLLLALRLDPRNLSVKLALAEARTRQREPGSPGSRSVRDRLREGFRRNAIDAAHFVGLAHLYSEKGETARAVECLEVAKVKGLANPSSHKLHGRLLFRRKDFDGAVDELTQALRLNPFDRETAESLGRAEYERKQYEAALRATVQAFLLLNEGDEEGVRRLRRRIQTLKQILGWGNRELSQVFKERQEQIHTAFDRLEWHRDRFMEEAGLQAAAFPSAAAPAQPRGGQLELAARLRRMKTWAHFSDEQIFRLTQVAEEEMHDAGSLIFAHRGPGRDFFVLEEGEVTVQRTTTYGTFVLGAIEPGNVFGEGSFVSGHERSSDVVAARPSHLLRLDAQALDALIEIHPEMGVQLYWSLWHSLARKLRSTNEQLKTFFSTDASPESFLRLRKQASGKGASVKILEDDKIRLFREQGISRKELITLAAFSREKRFAAGASLFQEGDEGSEMYVILEGRVIISKFIPGAGEEALAILERGDFFGEMSLIDGEPRSADARAYGGQLTVLGLDQDTVREVLAMDPHAALEFLQLLCRLIANRLREIDEKVIGWRIMSGERNESVSA